MEDDPGELLCRLFAMLTAQLEDGAALALEGQKRQSLAAQHDRAQALAAQMRDAATIARALVALTRTNDHEAALAAA